MANASEFKDMTAMIKIGKKRTTAEANGASTLTNGVAEKGQSVEPEVTKRQKTEEGGGVPSEGKE